MVKRLWWWGAAMALLGAVCTSTTQAQSIDDGLQQSPQLNLNDSVGQGALNEPSDVFRVSMRLVGLGYLDQPTGTVTPKLTRAIRLFQSVIAGRRRIGGNGRIAPGARDTRWLESSEAPQWLTLPGAGAGFESYEATQTNDDHDYGTSWAAEVIRGAGAAYASSHLAQDPGASRIQINDCSRRWGGDTPDHSGHETGLDIDVRVPRTDGESGTTITSGAYDRAAARAMLRAFRAQPMVSRILFNDPVLISEGLCTRASGHADHFHVELTPPGAPSGSRSAAASGGSGGTPSLASGGGGGGGNGAQLPPDGGLASGNQPIQGGGELEVLARIVKGEALSCSMEGKIAVAAVVMNRVKSIKFPNTITDVAHQPKQFSCYNPQYRQRLYEGPVPQTCYQAAQAAMSGQDPTGGADHYFNPYLVRPDWAPSMRFLKRIGTNRTNTHDFYLSDDHSREVAGNATKEAGTGGSIFDAAGKNQGDMFSAGRTGVFNPLLQAANQRANGANAPAAAVGSAPSTRFAPTNGANTQPASYAPTNGANPISAATGTTAPGATAAPANGTPPGIAGAVPSQRRQPTRRPSQPSAPFQASNRPTRSSAPAGGGSGSRNGGGQNGFDPSQILQTVLSGFTGNALGGGGGPRSSSLFGGGSSGGSSGGSATPFTGPGADKLGGLQADFRQKVERILEKLKQQGWQPRVVEGLRTRAQQAEKVRKGYSKTMNSRHLYGRAADIVDKRYGWGGPAKSHQFKFWKDLGAAAAAEGLTWGGNWRSFPDVAHVQQ